VINDEKKIIIWEGRKTLKEVGNDDFYKLQLKDGLFYATNFQTIDQTDI